MTELARATMAANDPAVRNPQYGGDGGYGGGAPPYYNEPYQPYAMSGPPPPAVDYNNQPYGQPYGGGGADYGQQQQPGYQQQYYNPYTGDPTKPNSYGKPEKYDNHYNGGQLPQYSVDGPDDGEKISSQTSVDIRHAFVRKVYVILSMQLVVTFGIALVFSLVDAARNWLINHMWVIIIFMVVGLALICAITCVPSLGRTFPTNIILLGLITICMAMLVSAGGAATTSSAFAIAAGITFAVTVGLTIFAIQTKWDFTGCGTFAFVLILVLLLFGILAAIFHNRIVQIVYASLGALVFSFYLVYDTQQVVGGKHRKYQYSVDDYVFGALTLYMDIINLFMMILTLVSSN